MYELRKSQRLPITIKQGWEFLSSPGNLKKITPPHMGFEIISGFNGEKMYAGMIINYVVKPFPGIPMKWTTEITHVAEPYYFVDEQRFGPYKFWHHKHFLREIPGGVEMEDIIHYKLPFGFLGRLAHPLIVKRQLDSIFEYRRKVLGELFGKL